MGFFSRFWSGLFGAFKNVFSFLLPVLKSSAGKIIEVGLPIALSIVADLANQQLPSEEKRNAAFEQLKAALITQGYAASASVLNLVIEMAVARLKAT